MYYVKDLKFETSSANKKNIMVMSSCFNHGEDIEHPVELEVFWCSQSGLGLWSHYVR
ncbi:hypothetical protein DEO72_LG8g1628 [Vigna unguiculata]|uniref:Uncharacterized protein n=1 Tax=Vigna unguiculata TaxID=3917 RepID=A0A4D6MQA4_VIGUN|nr:hypothetical protein DEO72_LG8g1628 [Vigna unguiculata]